MTKKIDSIIKKLASNVTPAEVKKESSALTDHCVLVMIVHEKKSESNF